MPQNTRRPDKTLLSSIIPEWKEWLQRRADANLLARSTVAYYKRDYKNYCSEYFENYTIEAIDHLTAKKFVSDLRTGNGFEHPYSKKSTKNAITAIRSVFTYIIEELHIISNNPFDNLSVPAKRGENKNEKIAWTEGEMFCFLEALETCFDNGYSVPLRWKAFFKSMATTGIRVEELVALKWKNINSVQGNHTIKIKIAISVNEERKQIESDFLKTDSAFREIVLSEIAYKELMKWKTEQKKIAEMLGSRWKGKSIDDFNEQYIFSNSDGSKAMNKNMPNTTLHKIIDRWNNSPKGKERPIRNITAYELRHSCTTLELEWGKPITEVAYNLGHKNLTMVNEVYGHRRQNLTRANSFDEKMEKRINNPETTQVEPEALNDNEEKKHEH